MILLKYNLYIEIGNVFFTQKNLKKGFLDTRYIHNLNILSVVTVVTEYLILVWFMIFSSSEIMCKIDIGEARYAHL